MLGLGEPREESLNYVATPIDDVPPKQWTLYEMYTKFPEKSFKEKITYPYVLLNTLKYIVGAVFGAFLLYVFTVSMLLVAG